eukprot:TRINITY_DN21616_c0_g1_i1.p1 TRINITY_DN21616_c0_g1~~TRINITY_DN21616_c0_g1_i1.p1  ORF type:complete len:504 (-),score=68.83 TRINITY_DN21616_c0_g1_i1:338-1849(-)
MFTMVAFLAMLFGVIYLASCSRIAGVREASPAAPTEEPGIADPCIELLDSPAPHTDAEMDENLSPLQVLVEARRRFSGGLQNFTDHGDSGHFVDKLLLSDLSKLRDVTALLQAFERSAYSLKAFLRQYNKWAKAQDRQILTELQPTSDMVVLGDLHGHFASLRAAFYFWLKRLRSGHPTYLVILGDFIDRGKRSVEVAVAVLALEMFMGGLVVVLRGNHEHEKAESDGRSFTFSTSLHSTFGYQAYHLHDMFYNAFWTLPAVASVTVDSRRYIMMHGGFSQLVFERFEQLSDTPLKSFSNRLNTDGFHRWLTPEDTFLAHILWSDFQEGRITWKPSSRRGKMIPSFGTAGVIQALDELGFDWFIGAHSHVNTWRSFNKTKGMITVLTADAFDEQAERGRLLVITSSVTPEQSCCCKHTTRQSECEHSFIQSAALCCKVMDTCSSPRFSGVMKCLGITSSHRFPLKMQNAYCENGMHIFDLKKDVKPFTAVNAQTEGHVIQVFS